MGLDRVFSQSLAGQAFVTAVGMYVWNQRIMNGARLAGLSHDSAFDRTGLNDPKLHMKYAGALAAPREDDGASTPTSLDGVDEQEAMATSATLDSSQPAASPPPPPLLNLANLNWDAVMARYPSWSHPTDRELTCPAGKTATLKRQTIGTDGTTRLIFAINTQNCWGCPLIRGCTKSRNPAFRKEIMMTLSPKTAASQNPARAPESSKPRRKEATTAAREASTWRPPAPREHSQARPSSHQPPQLVPSALRRMWRALRNEIETRVHIQKAPQVPAPVAYIAPDAARRQHRRYTWAERLARHVLGEHDSVIIELRYLGDAVTNGSAALMVT